MAMTMRTDRKAKSRRTINHFACQTVARLPGQAINTRKANIYDARNIDW
jgi:hypothetical protein